jgi:hypothetical protein
MRSSKAVFCLVLVGLVLFSGRLAQGAGPGPSKPLLVPGPAVWTQETSAAFSFTSLDIGVSFQCRLDEGSWETTCTSPRVYPSLLEGPHTFQVKAVDVATLAESAPESWSWTVDFTPPSIPPDKTVEATSPLGTPVIFQAADNLDPDPLLSCAPASGFAFALGTTNVTCTATDKALNASPEGVFMVTVVDTTPPVVAPHADVLAGQESAAGASVTYVPPDVTDNGDAAPVVDCAPASGGTFPLGSTPVTCSAADASGNTSSPVQFDVIVQQGAVPSAPVIESDVGRLTRRTTAIFTFSVPEGLTAECRLGSSEEVGSFGPCETPGSQAYTGLADGNYLFTLQVTNSIGNVNSTTHAWTVDTVPPTAVLGLKTQFGNGWIKLLWNKATDVDYSHVTLWRKRVGATSWKRLGTRSARSTFLDQPVPNDVRFEYSLRSFDLAGNRSSASKVIGRASRILSPRYGAVVSSPPLIDWTPVRNATYFNMQLWRDGRKILSVWPSVSSYRLHATWTFGGRQYALRKGNYRVYVWPGFGAKSAVDYGGLLGWTAFTVG